MLQIITAILIASAFILVNYIEGAIVEFDSSEFFSINVKYKLKINNQYPGQKFPVDNFVFAFELLLDEKIVAAVDSPSFTGDEYRGFSIKDFTINPINEYIEMYIIFSREAHETVFRIRYASAETEKQKEIFYEKANNNDVIFSKNIKIFIPYKITIQFFPEIPELTSEEKDALSNVLLPEKNGQLTCSATDGLPKSSPQFINRFELTDSSKSDVNEQATQLVWLVQLQDHGKQMICQAGRSQKNVTLNVYHYMTGVLTKPTIGEKLPRGSRIKCFSKDGYPTPKTRWLFVSGPLDASDYFEFQENETVLFINATAPLYSNWTFECTGSMTMPPAVMTYFKDPSPMFSIKQQYNFVVAGLEESSNLTVKSSSTGIVVFFIILILVIICGTLAAVIFKEKIRNFITNTRLGSSAVPKTPEKVLDHGYKYSEVDKVNGTEKEDATCYLEIVGTVQPKSIGPIHRV